jgi:hypothetical protein
VLSYQKRNGHTTDAGTSAAGDKNQPRKTEANRKADKEDFLAILDVNKKMQTTC